MELKQIETVHLIINPRSGSGRQKALLPDLAAAIERRGCRVVQHTTRWAGDATDYARGLDDPACAVAVWGGDGTVNEVVNGLAGKAIPVLPCRAGTENLLAKDLGIPTKPRAVARLLRKGRIQPCDIGRINGRNFLMTAGVGFDGEVVRRVAAARTGHASYLTYVGPIWRTFRQHVFPRMRVLADGQEIFDDRGMIFIGNISRYATGLRICRQARCDDGLLDVVIFRCATRRRMLLHTLSTVLRTHTARKDVIYRQFRTLRIESATPVASQIDGDAGPNTPLDVSLAGAQVNLLMPRRKEGKL